MKILHLANWNSTNIGNGALIFGTERLLREDIPGIEFVPEAWDDYTFKNGTTRKLFDERFVERVNAHDALLINGAVTFNAFRHTMRHTGMRLDLPFELWDEIKKPIIFYGVSYRCWPFQAYPNAQALKRIIEYCIAREDVFFGVRNDGTKEWIKQRLGIDSEKIREVPDPGVFVPHEDHEYPEFHPNRKNILIAVNGEDALHRFATPLQKKIWGLAARYVPEKYLQKIFRMTGGYKKVRREAAKKMAKVAEGISQRIDAQFILVPHYLDDYLMIDDFVTEIQERLAHQCVTSTGLLSAPHAAYFYGRYKKADLALSMRVHSMSPSIGLGTPVIPITSQGRMRNFLQKIGLSDIAVDITQDDFVERTIERACALLENPSELRRRTREAVERMRASAWERNKEIVKLLRA